LTSVIVLATDLVAMSVVYWIAVLGRYSISPGYGLGFYLNLFPVVGVFPIAFLVQGLYPGVMLHPAEELRRVFCAVTTVCLIIATCTFFWHNAEAYSRSVFLATWLMGGPVVVFARHIARKIFSKRSWWGVAAVVVGSGPIARRVAKSLRNANLGVRVRGFLSEEQPHALDPDLDYLGDLSVAPELAGLGVAQYAIVAVPDKSKLELRHLIQDYCAGFRHIVLVPDLPGLCSLGMTAKEIGGEVGFEVPQHLFHPGADAAKRTVDLLLSGLLLALLSPIFVLVALAIKFTSKGPAFFGHVRYGRSGSTFKAIKFRTMLTNGDEVLKNHFASNLTALSEWLRDQKLKDDPRVTPVGKFLRRYSIDELPQLINVFRGEMSLVGPRPIVKAEIPRYGKGYGLYTRVIPGITGLWQVSGRNNTTYEERVRFDEYYVRNWSVWLDAHILARTVKVVLTGDGAY